MQFSQDQKAKLHVLAPILHGLSPHISCILHGYCITNKRILFKLSADLRQYKPFFQKLFKIYQEASKKIQKLAVCMVYLIVQKSPKTGEKYV